MTSDRLRGLIALLVVSVSLILLVGYIRRTEVRQDRSIEPHGHHGGHMFKIDEDAGFRLEFTLDESRRRIVIYVQERETHRPFPLAAMTLDAKFISGSIEFESAFAADPRPEDPPGSSSRFALSLDSLPQQIISANRFQVNISISLGSGEVTANMSHNSDHGHTYQHD
ncbi:MAG: hypothetical protein AAF664_13595 [Planctomycetota bacterium]